MGIFGLVDATSGHLGLSGPFLGPSWSHHGRSWRHLGRLGTLLEPSWGHVKAILGPLGAILALEEPSWSPPETFLGPRKGPLGAILGPLGQKHENDTKKPSKSQPGPIDFCGNFGIILSSFSDSIFEPMFEQFLDLFWVHFWNIFG